MSEFVWSNKSGCPQKYPFTISTISTGTYRLCHLQTTGIHVSNLSERFHSSALFEGRSWYVDIRIGCDFTMFDILDQMHMEFHVRETKRKSLAKCDYCGFVLRNSELLIEHKEQHQSRPDFQCLECEFMGKTNNQLKRHMRVHVSSQEHMNQSTDSISFCVFCTLSIDDIQTKQLRYQCDVCGKAFYDSSSFHSHLKYHNNELNVECYLCKVKTLSVTSMRVHMRRHVSCRDGTMPKVEMKIIIILYCFFKTGEKPFQCSECGRRFARNDNLNAHFQLHFRAT